MYQLRNEGSTAELLLYGSIGEDWFGDGISAKQVLKDIAEVAGKPLDVRINSGGGDAFEGVAVFNALDRREGGTTVYVDALAASAASVIAMAGDSIYMAPGSQMMVHNPWTFAYGEASELRRLAEVLDGVRDSLVDIYQLRTARPKDDIQALMDAETWMTADQAVSEGFATEIDEDAPRIAAAAIPKGRYRNAPELPVSDRDAHGRPWKRSLAEAEQEAAKLRRRLTAGS